MEGTLARGHVCVDHGEFEGANGNSGTKITQPISPVRTILFHFTHLRLLVSRDRTRHGHSPLLAFLLRVPLQIRVPKHKVYILHHLVTQYQVVSSI